MAVEERRIQVRRDTAANWESFDPVLASGEFGYDQTNDRYKVGNGTDTWTARPWTSLTAAEIEALDIAPASHTHGIEDIEATGTPSSNTYLRGDGSWSTPTGTGGGDVPSPHELGGSHHSADTLANLNTKISDATLDSSSDPRTPTAHAASHEPGGSDEITLSAADVGAVPAAFGIQTREYDSGTGWPVRGSVPSGTIVLWIKRSASDPNPPLDGTYALDGTDIALLAQA